MHRCLLELYTPVGVMCQAIESTQSGKPGCPLETNRKNKLVTPWNKELVAQKDNSRRQNLIRVQGRMLDPLNLSKECLKHSSFTILEEELKTDKRE